MGGSTHQAGAGHGGGRWLLSPALLARGRESALSEVLLACSQAVPARCSRQMCVRRVCLGLCTSVFAGALLKAEEQAGGTVRHKAAAPGGEEQLVLPREVTSGNRVTGSCLTGCSGHPCQHVSLLWCLRVLSTQSGVDTRYPDSLPGSGWVGGQRAGRLCREQQTRRMEKADPECPLKLAKCRKARSPVIAENSLSVTWLGFVCCSGTGGIYTPPTASGASPQPNTKIG